MKKIILGLIAIATGLMMTVTPVFADCSESDLKRGCVNTAILGENGCHCDKSNDGQGVIDILNLVVNVLTIGVGVLGVIGITVVGIQYLTAGGNEAQVRKAKKRLFEIVIGLVVYVLIYAILKWLMPFFGG